MIMNSLLPVRNIFIVSIPLEVMLSNISGHTA
jgi:hypothetical protein